MHITGKQLREKFLNFFQDRDHTIIPSAPLVPSQEEQLEGKEKVLFTSAGMQPLIPYLLSKKQPPSNRLADVQKCLRTDDIEEVGDTTHHTFFEMLGNWSIGDYWKEEAIKLSFDFLTKELEIPIEKLAVTVFAGDEDANKDEESAKIWEDQGIPKERIYYFGKEHNWWPTGGGFGPCGPDTEMFYWAGEGEPEGKPNEEPRWVEIWNDVFMQFNKKEDGTLEDLPQKNVDTGMGLERTLAVLNGKDNDYETDLFLPLIQEIERHGEFETRIKRIIADHLKASIFLILDGVRPENKLQGYVLRRLLRRSFMMIGQHHINIEILWREFIKQFVNKTLGIYRGFYGIGENDGQGDEVSVIILDELDKFAKTLKKGLEEVNKIARIDGKLAFDLYQTFGFPLEITEELFKQRGQEIDHKQFEEEFKKHQELSRTASVGMFKGGLAGHSQIEIKYHTATHLLHQALRDVLGPEVFQKGLNINPKRLRFDFSFDRKLTDEEIKKVEDLVNKKIKEDLQVDHKTLSLEEARNFNAIGLFDEKYGDGVSLYAIGPNYKLDSQARDRRDRGGYYSLEFCGGPHVSHTGEIGGIKITKEEAVSAGIRRIRAELV